MDSISGRVNDDEVGFILQFIHHFQYITCNECAVFQTIAFCIFICCNHRFFNQLDTNNFLGAGFRHDLTDGACAAVQVEYHFVFHITGKFFYDGVQFFRTGGVCLEEGINRNLEFQIKEFFHEIISAIQQVHFIALHRIRQTIIHRMEDAAEFAFQFQRKQHIFKFLHRKIDFGGCYQIHQNFARCCTFSDHQMAQTTVMSCFMIERYISFLEESQCAFDDLQIILIDDITVFQGNHFVVAHTFPHAQRQRAVFFFVTKGEFTFITIACFGGGRHDAFPAADFNICIFQQTFYLSFLQL